MMWYDIGPGVPEGQIRKLKLCGQSNHNGGSGRVGIHCAQQPSATQGLRASHSRRVVVVDRSENMRRIRSKDTAPELIVRGLVHSLGYRFRLHRADLPGRPDLVFPSRKKVIFVHGCFWHQHICISRKPRSNQQYWLPKLQRNVARDAQHKSDLRRLGWRCLVVWECEVKNEASLIRTVRRFLQR